MPAKRTKPAAKVVKKQSAVRKVAAKKPATPKSPSARTRSAPSRIQLLDLSAFPPESVAHLEKRICLACVLDVFTRHMGLALRTAHLEIKRYTPTVEEVKSTETTRPYFAGQPEGGPCPYCGSAPKWHARLSIHRIQSGKATDTLRRELVKSLPKPGEQFVVLDEKSTEQDAFFGWLEKASTELDLDDPAWLRQISQSYLSRKEPKVDWQAEFASVHAIRRSRRLESGWEVDNGRLFLAPALFDELILVQYLVSRAHKAGGLTLEGRYTLPELFLRLRNGGYLRAVEIQAYNPADAFEQLVNHLSGGEASLRFYYIVDRRDYLEKVKALKLLKPPKPKAPQ